MKRTLRGALFRCSPPLCAVNHAECARFLLVFKPNRDALGREAPSTAIRDERHRELALRATTMRTQSRTDGRIRKSARSPITRDRKNEVSNQNDEHESKEQIGDPKGEGRAKIGNMRRYVCE
ncbi:MAG: hypothetical protein R3D52_00895 [Xanthobacteraceae bacterium]